MTFCKSILLLLMLSLLFGNSQARATLALDLSGAYFSDQMVSTSEVGQSYLFSQVAGYISIDSKKRFFVGWDYAVINHTVSGSTNTVFASTDTGPAIMYLLSIKKPIILSAAYHMMAQAAFQSTSTVAWAGTGYVFSIAYAPNFTTNLNVGVALNYWSAMYTAETTSSANNSISYGRNMLIPSLKIVWHPF